MLQINGQSVTLNQASAILSTRINTHQTLWRKALERHAKDGWRTRDEKQWWKRITG